MSKKVYKDKKRAQFRERTEHIRQAAKDERDALRAAHYIQGQLGPQGLWAAAQMGNPVAKAALERLQR